MLSPVPFVATHAAPEVLFTFTLTCDLAGEATFDILFTPDRTTLHHADAVAWWQQESQKAWPTWDALVTETVDTFYDTLLPKKVTCTAVITLPEGQQQVRYFRTQPTTA